jgi:squalene-hopene/tetraprenyl-beta-curcumene cyclase
LHNRLFLLWASSKLRDLLPAGERQAILDELWHKQEADGGFTIQSLGQWKKRDQAPAQAGSNSYATALVALSAGQAGVAPSQAGLSRALAWLSAHQGREGYWAADSMNHKHDPGTMPEKFMSDAATGYAAAALIAADDKGGRQAASNLR